MVLNALCANTLCGDPAVHNTTSPSDLLGSSRSRKPKTLQHRLKSASFLPSPPAPSVSSLVPAGIPPITSQLPLPRPHPATPHGEAPKHRPGAEGVARTSPIYCSTPQGAPSQRDPRPKGRISRRVMRASILHTPHDRKASTTTQETLCMEERLGCLHDAFKTPIAASKQLRTCDDSPGGSRAQLLTTLEECLVQEVDDFLSLPSVAGRQRGRIRSFDPLNPPNLGLSLQTSQCGKDSQISLRHRAAAALGKGSVTARSTARSTHAARCAGTNKVAGQG